MVSAATKSGTTTSEDITAGVLEALEHPRDERMGEVMRSLIRHLHDFAREVKLQPGELLQADAFLTACGKISSDSRHEFILLFDTLGLTMVVDTLAAAVADGALETSVLGPFYRAEAPLVELGGNLSRGRDDGEPVRMHGRVLDPDGRPVGGSTLELWSTNAHGLYENVDPDQPDWNLRGTLRPGDDGSYEVWTAKPVSYPVPADGPAGALLYAMDRHNMRPAHIHVLARAPGFQTIVTELFSAGDEYLDSDAVFGVKPSLVVEYKRVDERDALARVGREDPFWDLPYDLVLTPGEAKDIGFSTARGAAS